VWWHAGASDECFGPITQQPLRVSGRRSKADTRRARNRSAWCNVRNPDLTDFPGLPKALEAAAEQSQSFGRG